MAIEQVQVCLPPPALARHVVCAIRRALVGAGGEPRVVAAVQANGYACLNVVGLGTVVCGEGPPLPHCFVAGPLRRPLACAASVPLQSLSLVFQPWLLQPVFGLAPVDAVDRLLAPAVGTPRVRTLAAAAARVALGDAGWAAFWEEVAQAFAQVPVPDLARGALQGAGPAAAAAALGIGERQYRRRFLQAMGLPPRAWRRAARFEQALAGLPQAPLGALAADAGFTDQAHMSREFAALAGASPGRLRRTLAAEGGGTWSLAPVRVRNLQDGVEAAA